MSGQCEHPAMVGIGNDETGELLAVACVVCGEQLDPRVVREMVNAENKHAVMLAAAAWN